MLEISIGWATSDAMKEWLFMNIAPETKTIGSQITMVQQKQSWDIIISSQPHKELYIFWKMYHFLELYICTSLLQNSRETNFVGFTVKIEVVDFINDELRQMGTEESKGMTRQLTKFIDSHSKIIYMHKGNNDDT